MSTLNPNEVRNMMSAYTAVHNSELRTQLEEEQEELELLALEIIENAAYVLFSQGYNVQQLCEYFEDASENIIVEDFISFVEGQTCLSENFVVSDAYIEEQFQELYEKLGLLAKAGQALGKVGGAIKSGVGRAVNAVKTAATGGPIKPVVVKDITGKGGPLAKTGSSALTKYNPATAAAGRGATAAAAGASKGAGFFSKAANMAKGAMSKVGQFASKIPGARVLGKALPGIGAGLYGADAASRFSKGDWGGGLLSTAGAVTSLVPGAGAIGALAPAGIQAATDAMGLTGDKSKGQPGAPKSKPMDPKQKYNASAALGGKSAFQAGGGAAAMKKDPSLTAADVQKRGTASMRSSAGGDLKKGAAIFKAKQEIMAGKNRAAAPAKPAVAPTQSSGSGPAAQQSGSGKGKPSQAVVASQTPRQTSGQKPSTMDQWRSANPKLAAAADEKARIRGTAQTDNPLIDSGMRSRMPAGAPTVQSPDVAKLGAGNQRLTNNPYAGQSPTNKATGSKKPGSIVSGFDLFDVVMGHLLDEGYAETEDQALKIMANMSKEWKLQIIDEAVKGESSDRRRALAAERRKGIKPLPAKEGEKYASHKISQMAYAKRARSGDDD